MTKAQREAMLDYLVNALHEGGSRVQACSKKLVTNFKSNYIKVNDDGLVILCDREYTADAFKKFVRAAKDQYENVAVVFLKDGKTYFRTANPRAHIQGDGRSLKNYTPEQLQRIMLLRPEEQHFVSGKSGGTIQYYQPKSDRLEECLVEYKFQTVQFDYSHVGNDRFQPLNRTSVREYEWKSKNEHKGPVTLDHRALIFVPTPAPAVSACADMRAEEANFLGPEDAA